MARWKTRPGSDLQARREALLRPDVGTQAQFRKKKSPREYRYDSSLSPALDWDGQSQARERCEALIKQIVDAESLDQARAAAEELKRLSQPFLNWAGKAERLGGMTVHSEDARPVMSAPWLDGPGLGQPSCVVELLKVGDRLRLG
jgi:adenine-specific DNA-methyltransferase